MPGLIQRRANAVRSAPTRADTSESSNGGRPGANASCTPHTVRPGRPRFEKKIPEPRGTHPVGPSWQDRGVSTPYPPAQVPERLFDDEAAEARWRARFGAPRMSVPEWALDAPDANIYVSNASGVWEVYAWDRATGAHRRVTDRPNGTMHADHQPGRRVDLVVRRHRRRRVRLAGCASRSPATRRAQAAPAVAGVHDGYPAGLEIGHGRCRSACPPTTAANCSRTPAASPQTLLPPRRRRRSRRAVP